MRASSRPLARRWSLVAAGAAASSLGLQFKPCMRTRYAKTVIDGVGFLSIPAHARPRRSQCCERGTRAAAQVKLRLPPPRSPVALLAQPSRRSPPPSREVMRYSTPGPRFPRRILRMSSLLLCAPGRGNRRSGRGGVVYMYICAQEIYVYVQEIYLCAGQLCMYVCAGHRRTRCWVLVDALIERRLTWR